MSDMPDMPGASAKPPTDVSRETSDGAAVLDGAAGQGAASPKKEAASPPRNKRSSVYIYLLILFGAAFMMLLLAYFVQQRNSENAMSDLRTSMNLSREQLMEQIEVLEAERDALKAQEDKLRQQADELQQAYDEEFSANRQRQSELAGQLTSWELFWAMEEAYRAQDYEACAGFFQNEFASETYATPEQAKERSEEIRQELVQSGFLPAGDEPAG